MGILQELSEEMGLNFIKDLVYDMSRFHRIQGSDGLERAGRYIYDVLKEDSDLRTEMLVYDYNKGYGTFGPVIGWSVHDGELTMLYPERRILHRYSDSRTVVVAHSPPGKVDGEVVYVGDGEDPTLYGSKVEGKIVLAYGDPYIVYRQAVSSEAAGVILFKLSAADEGVPYLGLFLRPHERSFAKIPAVSISKKNAYQIVSMLSKGYRVRVGIRVGATYREGAKIPVIISEVGQGENEAHLFAHYCHPGGTVNDNISGAASLAAAAIALSRLIEKGKARVPDKHRIKFLWFPEYAGSLAYLLSKRPSVSFGINLDMIGEKQELTGSTINFIRPPPSLFHPYEAVVYYFLRSVLSNSTPFSSSRKVLSYRFDTASYSAGSDHDVYLHLGISSVMINQWPDRFYHSDRDTIDKFDASLSRSISLSAVSAAYFFSTKINESGVIDLAKWYFHSYLGDELLKTPENIREERHGYLIHMIGERIIKLTPEKDLGKVIKETPRTTIRDKGVKYRYVGDIGVIRLRSIFEMLGWDKYRSIKKIVDKDEYMRTVIQSLIPLYLRTPHSLSWLRKTIAMEQGIEIDKKVLRRIVDVLVDCRLMVKI